jgi:hypothetical protein
MAELIIGKWCLSEESINNDWIYSYKLTITFSKNGNISIFNKESQMICESTYELDESSLMIDSPQNCARYKLESVDKNQLILYNQGRSEIRRYKFKRC